jgi:hypothetical protein
LAPDPPDPPELAVAPSVPAAAHSKWVPLKSSAKPLPVSLPGASCVKV